jgi:hypothetical protein
LLGGCQRVKLGKLLQEFVQSTQELRRDPSIKFSLLLLSGVLIIGTASAIVGYFFGYQSLKGVTQPDKNPFLGADASGQQYPRQGNQFVSEQDIIAQVEKQIKGGNKAQKDAKKESAENKDKDKDKEKGATASSSPSPKTGQAKSLPITAENQGVKLEIRSLAVAEDTLTLGVVLRNEGNAAVQFLYDFLDITDDQSQTFSTEVKGLPTDLKAKSETFNGTIKVMGVSAETSKALTLSLSDYPEQKIKLEVSGIPVKP